MTASALTTHFTERRATCRNWNAILHSTACLCGAHKRALRAFCPACLSLLSPRLRWKLDTARRQQWFMRWWRFSAAIVAREGRTA